MVTISATQAFIAPLLSLTTVAPSPRSAGQSQGPSESEQRQIAELKARDREVRAHEMAHQAAGGGLVRGGASFRYEQGPDGHPYAVSGEVSIDTAPVAGDAEATLRKAQSIIAAALAPRQPSGQDRAVAAQASQMAAEARAERIANDNARNTPQNTEPIALYQQTAAANTSQDNRAQLLNITA